MEQDFNIQEFLAVFLYADERISMKAVQMLANSQFPIYHLKFGWSPPQLDSLHFKDIRKSYQKNDEIVER